MHDKHGNEIKRGDWIAFKHYPPHTTKGHNGQVEIAGTVARLFAGSTTCNVGIAYTLAQFDWTKDEAGNAVPDTAGAMVVAMQLTTATASECEVLWAVDGRPLLQKAVAIC